MSALDTFEQFIFAQVPSTMPELRRYLDDQRRYLLTLRSEDERQRVVEEIMKEMRKAAVRKG